MAERIVLSHWPQFEADDFVLAVNEAVTNVIEHAYPAARSGAVGLHASCGPGSAPATRRVIVSITDQGTWSGEHRVVDPAGRRGHGLTVMSTCVAESQIHRHSGTIGWAVIETGDDRPSRRDSAWWV
jgi:anti-sigma regulatory factor (Ser/Thr protein kinase)